jgi:toxin ParE1/3/4
MRAKRVEYHQDATADVKRAVEWYKQKSSKAALDFVAELNRAVSEIRKAPDRWPSGKDNTRRFLLWRFPFSIIYSEQRSVITIWAVAHGSRRPDYWASRLK